MFPRFSGWKEGWRVGETPNPSGPYVDPGHVGTLCPVCGGPHIVTYCPELDQCEECDFRLLLFGEVYFVNTDHGHDHFDTIEEFNAYDAICAEPAVTGERLACLDRRSLHRAPRVHDHQRDYARPSSKGQHLAIRRRDLVRDNWVALASGVFSRVRSECRCLQAVASLRVGALVYAIRLRVGVKR